MAWLVTNIPAVIPIVANILHAAHRKNCGNDYMSCSNDYMERGDKEGSVEIVVKELLTLSLQKVCISCNIK